MSRTAYGGAPRRRIRISVITHAAMIPRMMHNAYARTGRNPTCQTAELGLGMAAIFTGAHATAPGRQAEAPDTDFL
jgi:hypothetical protein